MFRLVLEIAVAFQKYVMRCKFIVVHRRVTVAQDVAARKRVLIDREPEGLWVLKSGQRAPGSKIRWDTVQRDRSSLGVRAENCLSEQDRKYQASAACGASVWILAKVLQVDPDDGCESGTFA